MAWVDVAVGAGGGATAVGIIGAFLVQQVRHAIARVVRSEVTDELKAVKNDITALHLKLTKETGGNSNGLRQKVNELGEDLAYLKGAFEQYVEDGR